MADNDDINKKNTPINGQSREFLRRIQKIGEEQKRATGQLQQYERQRFEASEAALNAQYALEHETHPESERKKLLKDLVRYSAISHSKQSQIEMITARRADVADARYQNLISKQYSESNINGEISRLSGVSHIQERSRLLFESSRGDQPALEARKGFLTQQLTKLENIQERAASMMLSDDPNKISKATTRTVRFEAKRAEIVEELAAIQGAERITKRMGRDIHSREENLFKIGAKASHALQLHQIGEDIASGRIKTDDKTLSNLKQQETNLMKQLVAELEKLKTATGSTAEELRKSAENIAENLEQTGEKISQIHEKKYDQENRGSSLANKLMAGSSTVNTVGGLVSDLLIGRKLGQAQAISGLAEWENLKYSTYESASAGDIKSQMILANQYFKKSENFGNDLGGAQVVVNASQALAAGLQGSASILGLGSSMGGTVTGQVTGTAGMSVVAGMQNLNLGLEAGGVLIRQGVNAIGKGPSPDVTAVKLQGRHAFLQQELAKGEISAKQIQKIRDFTVGMSEAGMYMGGAAGEDLINKSVDPANVKAMAEARISPSEMVKLSTFGVQSMGNLFNKDQVFLAKQMERANLGSAQMNLQRMATLTSAGSNNPADSLKNVLEAAFSKSLNDSKVLNEMVSYTSQMAEKTALTSPGLDTAGEYAKIIAAGVTPNTNNTAEVKRAASIAQELQQLATGVGINYTEMAATASITRKTGLSATAAQAIQTLDPAQIAALKNKPEEINKKFEEMGILDEVAEIAKKRNISIPEYSNEILDEVNKQAKIKQISRKDVMLGYTSPGRLVELRDKKNRTEAEEKELRQAENMARRALTSQGIYAPGYINQVFSGNKELGPGNTLQERLNINPESLTAKANFIRTQGAAQESGAMAEPIKNLENAAKVVEFLQGLAEVAEKMRKEGEEGKAKDAARKEAGEMPESAFQAEEMEKMVKSLKDNVFDPLERTLGDKGLGLTVKKLDTTLSNFLLGLKSPDNSTKASTPR